MINSVSDRASSLRGSRRQARASYRGRSSARRASLALSLLRASTRELVWGLRLVSAEVRGWLTKAEQIPDPTLRECALEALSRKRGNANGAALFWSLPDRRNRELLSVLVAYELLADYLDCVNERTAELGLENGRRLQRALVEALDVEANISDYYQLQGAPDDGGYLTALVRRCRSGCELLPRYQQLKPMLMEAAGLSTVLAINHESDPVCRDRALEDWADGHGREMAEPAIGAAARRRLSWYEQTAGSSAWLTVLAMLALAARPDHAHGQRAARATFDAYLYSISVIGAMLDSYGDIDEDRARAHHSYVDHYPTIEAAVERICQLIVLSRAEARALPSGSRHEVIVACMVAYYLSKDSAKAFESRAHTRRLRRAGGPMVQTLIPVLRMWRNVYGQRSM